MNVVIDGVLYVPAPEQPKPSTMNEDEKRILAGQIDKSGLSYAMLDYSSYDSGRNRIDDQRFHQLRNAFVDAHGELHNYLTEKGCMP